MMDFVYLAYDLADAVQRIYDKCPSLVACSEYRCAAAKLQYAADAMRFDRWEQARCLFDGAREDFYRGFLFEIGGLI